MADDWLENIHTMLERIKSRKRIWCKSIAKKDSYSRINTGQKRFRPDVVSKKDKDFGINKRRVYFDTPDDFNNEGC